MRTQWFSVKYVIEHLGLSDEQANHVYEERVILVRASTLDEAIQHGETNARKYAAENNASYAGYINAFSLDENVVTIDDGTEVYSVMRETVMSPAAFITHYYDDGSDKRQSQT